MFAMKKPDEDSGLQKTIDKLLSDMDRRDPESEEYSKMVDQLIKLYGLRTKSSVSPDALITVAGNLLGIMIIVGHERAHVVTSKALEFVRKLK